MLMESHDEGASPAAGPGRRAGCVPVRRVRGGAGMTAGLRRSRLSLRPAGRRPGRWRPGCPGGVVDLSIGTPTDPPPPAALEALWPGGRRTGARLPAVDRDPGAAPGHPAVGKGHPRRRGPPRRRGRLRRHQGVRGRRAAVVPPAQPRARHRPLPGRVLPDLRDGRPAGRAAGRPGPRRRGVAARPGRRSTRPTPSGRCSCGSTRPATRPAGSTTWPAVARWGRERGVPVFSDECYAEFTWDGPPRTILGHGGGPDGLDGVVAVHSLSKRSNLAGMRVGWYSGDPELVGYLREVRKHAGFMVPGPVAAGRRRRPRRTPPTSTPAAGAVLGAPGAGPGDPGRPRGRL